MSQKKRMQRQTHKKLPVDVGGRYVLQVEGLTHEGSGVGQVDGYTLFVAGALPGDEVRVRVTGVRSSYGFAVIEQLLQASSDRMEPPCEVFGECGGCQIQHLSYEAQLRWKRQMVEDSLRRIGKLHELQEHTYKLHETLGMKSPWRYRNKVQLPVAASGAEIKTGFYARGSHDVIDTEHCLIQADIADEISAFVRHHATALGISAYDERTHRGCLRQVMIRAGYASGEVMVVFVTNGPAFRGGEQLVERLQESFPQVVSILQNINSNRTNVILGEQTRLLWGREEIFDAIGEVQFAISCKSFYQVNPLQTSVLYEKVEEYAALTGVETVIDTYCGVGTIGLFLASKAKRVFGVEVVEQAVVDARRNAALNGITNAEFVCGLAETVMPEWRDRGVSADVIVVDPPRKGCEPTLLQTLLDMAPLRIVYVSCNPATLARDLQLLVGGGYVVEEVQPVDMFPQTTHVECVILMTRKG